MLRLSGLLSLCLIIATPALAAEVEPLGVNLSDYDYPYPVHRYAMPTPHGQVQMAYMDIPAAGDAHNAPVIVLLHGKNFSGAYWGDTATWLSKHGYRVIVPDQIGFGKSDKPAAYSYTFHHLAANTHALLDSLDIEQATILGHSMGGMLAMRYALMYPETTPQLVLVDPIGLEDWKAKGVPYRGIQAWYAREMQQDYAGIKAYQTKSYYHGDWKPAYQPWAQMLAGMHASPDRSKLAWAQAATYDMVYTQPVYYEFGDIQPQTTLMIGSLDRTALGKDLVSDAKAAQLGNYPALSKSAVSRMPHAQRVVFDGVGHLPFIEAPKQFRAALAETLDNAAKNSHKSAP
ncbi:alpha/beta hydrolase [Salinisphaera sp. SPP-AMP-43]|uniref:alpha/beta fold hydrolase n=1 Tax=Salinisphaera sp. SPP-AMP-43 TaxID=3121288 RepID=UPI003C6E261E